MGKAIKHIQAGLLHIEVIGMVPGQEIERKGRAARSNPTPPAQQFYNLKTSWRELELKLAANFGGKDMVLTFTFDDAHLPKSKKEAGDLFQKFVRKLKNARKKRVQETMYIVAPEGIHEKRCDERFGNDGHLEDRRFHLHVVLNSTGLGDLEEIRSLWQFGGYIRAERLDVHYYRELAQYLTKEAREFGKPRAGEKTYRSSRNLGDPEIEYWEVPDSVTLTPPPGAVDYVQFSEKNPYGFGECIGARYLIFPAAEPPEYSYTQAQNQRRRPNNF